MKFNNKPFFGQWYGKIALACLTALAVAATIAVARVPLNDRAAIVKMIEENQKEIEHNDEAITAMSVQFQAASERMSRIETNIEWLVKRWGGNPQ